MMRAHVTLLLLALILALTARPAAAWCCGGWGWREYGRGWGCHWWCPGPPPGRRLLMGGTVDQ